jgi:DNA-binding transcriptional MerR regulator
MDAIEGNAQLGAQAAGPARSLLRIGEVSRLTATKPFVLRYWETEFPMLQPVKSPKGHRLYRREDIDTVFTIKRLLYNEGFTIAGARRHLREQTPGAVGNNTVAMTSETETRVGESAEIQTPESEMEPIALLNRKTLLDLRDSLRSLLTALESE